MNDRLTACMADDFMHDPMLAARVIFGPALPEIPPHEEIMLWAMWTHTHLICSSGFGTGKTLVQALWSALQCILVRETTVGLVSGTMRQEREYYQRYFKAWFAKCPIFRNEIAVNWNAKPRIHIGNEACEIWFGNGSRIRSVPPDIFGNAERVKSEDWTHGVFDEWTSYGHTAGFKEFMTGRVRKLVADGYDYLNPVFHQKFFFFGTAKSTEHPCYQRVKSYQDEIARGSKDHALISFTMDDVPDRYARFREASRGAIAEHRASLSWAQFQQEVKGKWIQDSSQFYSGQAMDKCRGPARIWTAREPNNDWAYLCGIDVAHGGQDPPMPGEQPNKGDDCGIFTWRVRLDGTGKAQAVHAWRYTGMESRQLSAQIHRQNAIYRYHWMMIDPGGGGAGVRDILRSAEQSDKRDAFSVVPIIQPRDAALAGIGNPILLFASSGEPMFDRLGMLVRDDGDLVNRMHDLMRGAFTNELVELPPAFPDWPGAMDPNEKRVWLNSRAGLPEHDRVLAEVDLALDQLKLVTRDTDREGRVKLTSRGQATFGSKRKKDLAYAMAYGYLAVHLYQEMARLGDRESQEETLFVAASDGIDFYGRTGGQTRRPVSPY